MVIRETKAINDSKVIHDYRVYRHIQEIKVNNVTILIVAAVVTAGVVHV